MSNRINMLSLTSIGEATEEAEEKFSMMIKSNERILAGYESKNEADTLFFCCMPVLPS
jgi:hypothetical protein